MVPATVHLLCGLNAAGKSTLARRLAADLPAHHYALDERLIGRFPSLDYATEEYGVTAMAEREGIWHLASGIFEPPIAEEGLGILRHDRDRTVQIS